MSAPDTSSTTSREWLSNRCISRPSAEPPHCGHESSSFHFSSCGICGLRLLHPVSLRHRRQHFMYLILVRGRPGNRSVPSDYVCPRCSHDHDHDTDCARCVFADVCMARACWCCGFVDSADREVCPVCRYPKDSACTVVYRMSRQAGYYLREEDAMREPAIARWHVFAVPLEDQEERPTVREAFAEFECRCEGRVGSKYLVNVVEEGANLFSRKNERCLMCGGTVEEEEKSTA